MKSFELTEPFYETFLTVPSLSQNYSRLKVHYPDLEVYYDWSTFLTACFSRYLLGEDCVTSQKNIWMGSYT